MNSSRGLAFREFVGAVSQYMDDGICMLERFSGHAYGSHPEDPAALMRIVRSRIDHYKSMLLRISNCITDLENEHPELLRSSERVEQVSLQAGCSIEYMSDVVESYFRVRDWMSTGQWDRMVAASRTAGRGIPVYAVVLCGAIVLAAVVAIAIGWAALAS